MSDQYGAGDAGQYGSPQQPPSGPPTGGMPPYGPPSYGAEPSGYGAAPSGQAPQPSVGFFGALFDFSFNHFVTPMIIKVVYVLATVALALVWLVLILSGFSQSAGLGLLTLVVGAVVALFYLALVRMTLEFYLAVVRMSEDVHKRLPFG